MRKAMMVWLAMVIAMGLTAYLAAGPAETKEPPAVLRVNCGADKEYTDQTGATWSADQMYAEGKTWGAIGGGTVHRTEFATIEGTKAPEVYLYERWGLSAYRFDLTNGKYTVRLHFAETHGDDQRAGARIFTVSINGKAVLPDFDVFVAAGGYAKPVVKEFKDVEVTDGKLMIEFTEKVNHSEINGIEIAKP